MSMSKEDMQILTMWRNNEFDTVMCNENQKEYEIIAFVELVSEAQGLAVFTEHNMFNILKPVMFEDGKLYELNMALGGRLYYLTDEAIQNYNDRTIFEGGYICKVHYKDRTEVHYNVE